MKCRHCRHEYRANLAASWPGGFSAPGSFFYLAALLGAVTVALFFAGDVAWGWTALGCTILSLLHVLLSWHSCHGPCGFSQTGDETCPKCQGRNRIYPWSF